MKNLTSLLLMLLILGVFIQSSQAIECYSCLNCDEQTSGTCNGEVCVTSVEKVGGAFTIYGFKMLVIKVRTYHIYPEILCAVVEPSGDYK